MPITVKELFSRYPKGMEMVRLLEMMDILEE
jgi:hypothetical protein